MRRRIRLPRMTKSQVLAGLTKSRESRARVDLLGELVLLVQLEALEKAGGRRGRALRQKALGIARTRTAKMMRRWIRLND